MGTTPPYLTRPLPTLPETGLGKPENLKETKMGNALAIIAAACISICVAGAAAGITSRIIEHRDNRRASRRLSDLWRDRNDIP